MSPYPFGPEEKNGLLLPPSKAYTLLTDHLLLVNRSGLSPLRKSGSSQTIHDIIRLIAH